MRSVLLLAAVLAAPTAAQTPFTELALTDASFADPLIYVDSAAPADVDGDGDLDLLTVGYRGNADRLVLYRNDGVLGDSTLALTPVAVPFPSGAAGFRADLAWGDYDNDGDPDVVVGLSDEVGAGFGRMALYRNDAGTLVLTPTALLRYGESSDFEMLDHRSLTWADADNDGDLDLLVPSARSQSGFETLPTTLLRNDGPGAGGAWTFTPAATLPRTYNAVTAWADQDDDGDLDLLLAEFANSLSFTRTYRNDGGAFTPAGPALPHVWNGTADWGDADADGDPDVLVAGLLYENGTFTSEDVRVYVNEGASYDTLVVVERNEPGWRWISFRAATWADYDSDGDVDVLVAGVGQVQATPPQSAFVGRSRVYANDGAGGFTLAAELPGPSEPQYGGAVQWFDIDGDGDLDYFITGAYEIPGGGGNAFEYRTQLFRNDTPTANAPPSAPGGLSAVPGADGVVLAWSASTDDGTPAAGLTYNLHVRHANGSDIVSPMSRPGGVRMLPEAGNVSHNTAWALSGLDAGQYTWSVQAVDNAFNGGAFAAEGTFTVGATAAEGGPATSFRLVGAAPNPTRGAVSLALDVPEAATVSAEVFDVLGRRVLVLAPQAVEAGAGRLLALDARSLPAGAYVVRVTAESAGTAETRSGRFTVAR